MVVVVVVGGGMPLNPQLSCAGASDASGNCLLTDENQ